MERECAYRHSRKRDGLWQRGDDETAGVVFTGNGKVQVKMQCNRCGSRSGPLPYALVKAWGLNADGFGWTKTNDAIEYEPCVVYGCGVTPTEHHHFAPRNTFGSECEDWPVLPLCRPHHQEWHQRMDGYQWHRKGVAA